jgi:hypothetical protein
MIRPFPTLDTIWMTFNQGESATSILKCKSASLGNGSSPESYPCQCQNEIIVAADVDSPA